MEFGIMSGKIYNKVRKVNNENYLYALNDIDNIKIMQKACKIYRKLLEYDDIKSCKMIGLWKALTHFDNNRNTKFTTFLYNIVKNECRKRMTQLDTKVSLPSILIDTKCNQNNMLDDIIDGLQHPLDEIIRLRYIDSMTLKEISNKLGINTTSVRRKIRSAIRQIKQEWI